MKSQQNIIELVTRPWCHQKLHKNENQRAKITSETESFVCPTCNKGFANKEYLKNHMKIHEKKAKAYKCDICSQSFSTKNGLKFHIESAHTSQEKRDYCCPVCNANFISGTALKRHLTQAHNYTHNKYDRYTKVKAINYIFLSLFFVRAGAIQSGNESLCARDRNHVAILHRPRQFNSDG